MITTYSHNPNPRLAGLVRGYRMRQIDLGDMRLRIPLTARPQVTLDFYLRRSSVIEKRGLNWQETPPLAAIVGPQTHRRFDVLVSGQVDMFSVEFAPTALHAFFGISMSELTDEAIAAENLWGASVVGEIYERLEAETTIVGRAAIIETDLLKRLPSSPQDPIAIAAENLWATGGGTRVDDLALSSGLSSRHFSRLFTQRVGIPPKTYARILRLHVAIAAKTMRPEASWADIAQEAGYFDQAHLDKDFRALADVTPSGFTLFGPAA
jgi:AraC-like DNA-binding protein